MRGTTKRGEKAMTAYEIRPNTQFNSLEIYFTEKPGEKIREALKALKFRWNGKKACWYGYGEAEEVKRACEGEKIKKQGKQPKTAKPDTEAMAAYLEEMADYWRNDPGMMKHFRTTTAAVVRLDNGDLIPIDKPRIETKFCFGYGLYGRSTEEEYNDAENMRQHAETSKQYFIAENLKGIEETIKDLKDDSFEVYTALAYIKQDETTKTKSYHLTRIFNNPEYNPAWWANYKELQKMTDADRQKLITAYEEVKQQFIKRLNTYLKRYGLSKIDTWTYLVD